MAIKRADKPGKIIGVKKLRYELKTVIELDPMDAGEITDVIERNRELGSCEIVDVSVVQERDEG